MKTVKFSLNPQSIESAIKELKDYRDSIEKKTETVVEKVSEAIENYAEVNFNGHIYDDIVHEGMRVPNVTVSKEVDGKTGKVIADGKEAVFAEFGAGVYYNPSGGPPRPSNVKAIGTYGKGYGSRKVWGFEVDGKLKLTHGTPASRPLWNAKREVKQRGEVQRIGKEVFGVEGGE